MRKNDWTEEEIKILKNGYEIGLTAEEISKQIKRSISSIRMKASRLKIANEGFKESKPHKNLTGKKFNHLTPLKSVGLNKYNHMMWECKCDCGNPKIITVSEYNLVNGHTKSCGCLVKETCRKNFKKYNTYDLSGKYGIGYTDKNEEFLFDLEDYDLIKNYYWHVGSYGYLQTTDSTGKTIIMHRLIMGISHDENYKNIDIDHIHGENIRDNRKSNLRLATRSQNNMNRKIQSNNTSGYVGVTWNSAINKWDAQIGLNKKTIHLGTYSDINEAIKARKKAEEKYFGQRSYNNSRNMNLIGEINE